MRCNLGFVAMIPVARLSDIQLWVKKDGCVKGVGEGKFDFSLANKVRDFEGFC